MEKPDSPSVTLEAFIQTHDHEGSVLLLAGKREVLNQDAPHLIALGELLASRTRYMVFRSGNAKGADYLFSQGVANHAPKRLQVVTPFAGHRSHDNLAHDTWDLEDIDLAAEPEILYLSKSHKNTTRLVDLYYRGDRSRHTMKAAYIIRDTVMVLGQGQDLLPASAGIFYDDLENPLQGGTGHTMRVCREKSLPVLDQRVWMEWLA